uniref:tRNA pseudouridine synthase n=1 Tax=Oryza punctata TaxID=4537 RepID=A0A0E0LEC5_ORYPU
MVKLHTADENCDEGTTRAICIELVANRFLRKMVRVLVATAIREAAAGAEEDALLNLMEATCRRATAPPAPPDGLCLVDVGYEDFNRQRCFIVD